MRATKKEYEEQLANLRNFWPKGSTVYTILRSVSRSGMQRTIGLVSMTLRRPPGPVAPGAAAGGVEIDIRHPNYGASVVLDAPWAKGWTGDGIKIRGAGMDMGFHVAYSLGQALYGDGYALKHRWL